MRIPAFRHNLCCTLCVLGGVGCGSAPRNDPFSASEVGLPSMSSSAGNDAGDTESDHADSAESDPSGGSAAPDTGDDDDTETGSSVPASSSSDDGVAFDVGSGVTEGRTADGGNQHGCTSVDLLFVIDNSGSMGFYQDRLAAAFPGFVDAMWEALPSGTDLHVGVTTTHGFYGLGTGESTTNCVSNHSPEEILQNFTPPDQVDSSQNGARGRLYEHEGKRFFAVNTNEDRTPIKNWFAGAATRGEAGTSIEMPSAAVGYVAHPANQTWNTGFIRDAGSVLVVFVLSDEPDKSPEPVTPYVDMLSHAKATCGGIDCILTAGIVSQACYGSASDPTLAAFLESFGEPAVVGDIGLPVGTPPDYSQVVGDALAQVIAQKCNEIPPAE